MGKRKKPKNLDENYHHRRPKKLGGSGKIGSPNMVKVLVVKHRAWHCLFSTKTPEEIAATINRTWLDPDYEMVAVKKDKPQECNRVLRRLAAEHNYVPTQDWELDFQNPPRIPPPKGGSYEEVQKPKEREGDRETPSPSPKPRRD